MGGLTCLPRHDKSLHCPIRSFTFGQEVICTISRMAFDSILVLLRGMHAVACACMPLFGGGGAGGILRGMPELEGRRKGGSAISCRTLWKTRCLVRGLAWRATRVWPRLGFVALVRRGSVG